MSTNLESAPTGQLNQDIANAVVRGHHRHAGRGPTRAQAFYRHNVVVVVMQDMLTRGERSLAASGHEDVVLQFRAQLQDSMRAELIDGVQDLTGCGVRAMLSDSQVDPDVAMQVFVLDGPVRTQPPAGEIEAA